MASNKEIEVTMIRNATELLQLYKRQATHLLEQLVEPECYAARRGEQIVLMKKGRRFAVSSGIPTGVLAGLLEDGSVICVSKAGKSEFRITDAGRKRLKREESSSETPFADQHRQIETRVDEEGQKLRINTKEDPFEIFRRQKSSFSLIGEAELAAGERLRSDLKQAHSVSHITTNWSCVVVDRTSGNNELLMPERVMAAKARVKAALSAVGPDFSSLLVDVCGFYKGLETLEREYALPQRAGKVALGYALRALARHYGLTNVAKGKEHMPIRNWRDEKYEAKIRSNKIA